MKLVTFVAQETERFGVVLTHPVTGEDWVFDPEEAEKRLQNYASRATSPYRVSRPHFLEERPWPRDLASFLSLGDAGMSALRRLQDYLQLFLEQVDAALLAGAGFPLQEVKLRAPIPHPRLCFGLVQNSPTHWRNDPTRSIVNVFPQGHQRPQGTIIGQGDPVFVASDAGGFGWNPEFGAIIGRGGKNIDVDHAMDHVAGYTVVLDICSHYYGRRLREEASTPWDWFDDATASWLGKKSNTNCPIGPFLTTKDEVGNPYDLMVYTRQSGWQRDRAHTGAMIIGIERTISWLSSFQTLYPGDVVHMATMGVDGVPMTEDMTFGPEDYLEGEIEKVGTLRVPVVEQERDDWRAAEDPGRQVHPVPVVRDAIKAGRTVIATPEEWALGDVRHFWTVFGNYEAAPQVEGLDHRPYPRVLNCAARALAFSGESLCIPRRARTLSIGVELAFVIGQLADRVSEGDAADHILGYGAMAVLHDSSFFEPIRSPATLQESNLPTVYARWADGSNMIGSSLTPLKPEAVRKREMYLSLDGAGEVHGNTDEYLLLAPKVLSFLSQQIALFPGDVVTMGRTCDLLTVPAGQHLPEGTTLRASIEGMADVCSPVRDERELPSE